MSVKKVNRSKGVYNYHKKKNKKKKTVDKRAKLRKEYMMQATCNHIAKNDGKSHFKTVEEDGMTYKKCKICKDLMITDKSLLTKSAIEYASRQLSTILSLARVRISLSDELYNKISDALFVIKMSPVLAEELWEKKNNKKKNKKNKDDKKRNKKKKCRRVDY